MLKKLKKVVIEQASQGVSAEKISESMLFGILLGICPILGISTLIGVFLGYILRLNHIVVQSVSYLMYPVQLIMIPIYIKVLSEVTGETHLSARPDVMIKLFAESPIQFWKDYAMVALYAVILWIGLCLMSYFGFKNVFIRWILLLKKSS